MTSIFQTEFRRTEFHGNSKEIRGRDSSARRHPWVVVSTMQTFFALSPCLLLTTGPFPPSVWVSRRWRWRSPLSLSLPLSSFIFPDSPVAFRSAPLPPVAQHGQPPPSLAASPTAQVGPSPSLTLAFGFPPSSLNDASATCGPIILAPEEGIRRRNRRRAEMIKWKGGR